MNPLVIISRKRDGLALTRDQIFDCITAYVAEEIPDYQMSALLMAIYLKGMNADETCYLTEAMLCSGDQLALTEGHGIVVDKHSTGGIGDKVSLLLAPLLACLGFRVPMLSGRSLGITGGTLDKLESVPGFRATLSPSEIDEITTATGCVICGASDAIAPADKLLYRLRDVTATVGSIPLITASILAKKLAENPAAIVFDIKCGHGALMKTPAMARELGRSLIDTSGLLGLSARALITDMSQPLGMMIGNTVEVREAWVAMEQGEPHDLIELTLALATQLLEMTGRQDLQPSLRKTLVSGEASRKFQEMIARQGGDLEQLPDPAWEYVESPQTGYVSDIDSEGIGRLLITMGGGRMRKEAEINHEAGIKLNYKIGDQVRKGQLLAGVTSPSDSSVLDCLASMITIEPESPELRPLIIDTMY